MLQKGANHNMSDYMRKNVKSKITWETYKYIEAELRGYKASRRELSEMEQDIIASVPVIDNPEAGHSGPGDPTSRKALQIINDRRLLRLHSVIRAIEDVYEMCNDDEKRLIELRYWNNRYKDAGVADKLHIGTRTVYRWSDKIVLAIAAKLGFI